MPRPPKPLCGDDGGIAKHGGPCRMPASMGTKRCVNHRTDVDSVELKKSIGMGTVGAGIPGAGRKKVPKAMDILRARVEAEVDDILAPIFAALRAEKGISVSGGAREPGFIEYVDDIPTRLRAAAELLDRAYGKPKQTTELSGIGGEAISIELPRSSERAADVARILAGAGALPSPPTHGSRSRRSPSAAAVPVRTNGNGDGGM